MNRTALSLTPGMSDKGDSGHEESDEGEDILDYNSILRCRICCQYYRKPRILPCGHTFCEECLIQLRDKTSREWRIKFPLRNKHGDGGTLHCQAPGCRYSMKLMNLTRWAPRNRVASAALKVFQRNGAAKTVRIPTLYEFLFFLYKISVKKNKNRVHKCIYLCKAMKMVIKRQHASTCKTQKLVIKL